MTEKRRIRSTSDADLAARHDKEPYTCVGRLYLRSATGEEWPEDYRIFAPRVECIPSRDPYPYVEVAPGIGNTGRRYASREQAQSIILVFRPRPRFARPEPNPILAAIRRAYAEGVNRAPGASMAEWVSAEMVDGDPESLIFYPGVEATPTDIEDARKVLTRLPSASG